MAVDANSTSMFGTEKGGPENLLHTWMQIPRLKYLY